MSGRSLARHTSIYAIAPLVQRALALVLVSLYTSKLTVGEWGIACQADLFLGLMPLLLSTSLIAGLTRHYFLHQVEADRRSVVSGTCMALVAFAWLTCLGALLARRPIAALLFGGDGAPVDGSFVDLVVVAAVIVPFSVGTRLGIEYLQIQRRSVRVTQLEVAKTLLEAALKLWMIFGLEWGVMGFLLAVLIGEALFGTALVVWILAQLGTRFDWRTFRPVLFYALPLVPVALFQLGLHQGDKLLIEHLGPQNLVPNPDPDLEPITLAKVWLGIYGFGYMLPMIFHMAALSSFMRIWQPHVFALRDGRERVDELRRTGTVVAVGFAFCYAQVAIFAREAVTLLAGAPAYYPAKDVVPLVALAYLLYALHSLGQTVLLTAKATRTLSVLNGVSLALNCALNVWLIRAFGEVGYLGAAVATLVTFAFLAAVVSVAATRRLAAPFDVRTVAPCVLAAAGVAAAAYGLDGAAASPVLAIGGKLALSALLAAGLWRGALPPDVRASLRDVARRMLRRGA